MYFWYSLTINGTKVPYLLSGVWGRSILSMKCSEGSAVGDSMGPVYCQIEPNMQNYCQNTLEPNVI